VTFGQKLLEDPFILLIPLALLIGILAAGLLLRSVLIGGLRRWSVRTSSNLGLLAADTLYGPAVLWILIFAVHVATQNSEIPQRYQRYIHPTLEALWVWSLISAVSRLAGRSLRLYGGHVTGAQSVTSLTEKVLQLAILALGGAWLLRVIFNVNLTTILTTLGVGGLAVALALQDTLSNLFAGFYISISGFIRLGDYVRVSTGEEGTIADINWRCTTIRSGAGNLIVIPNSKLGQATFTNYFLPELKMGTSISASVAFDSDIDHVEAILLEEAKLAASEVPGMLADPEPSVRFTPGPSDWGLVYQVNFNVARFSDQFLAQSELRKRIFRRFCKEGIKLPEPGRTIAAPPPAS